ncbi:MAG: hypothetical protein IJS65_00865 [Clostridia bacterium]|nr:hypothetical protein [Clostridia bacterium]
MDISPEIKSLFSSQKDGAVIAIDGRCASGKTTLASLLEKAYGCRVVHMDDFFLPPAMRAPERLLAPGGNVHYERFLSEVAPCLRGGAFSYGAYDCKSGETVVKTLPAARYTIVEGSYSLHPALFSLYDLRLFCDVSPETQIKRLYARDGARARVFFDKWIPLEEKYFSACAVKDACDLIIKEF